MMGPLAARLPGDRLHLHHGPIDLIIGADGAREAAFGAAEERFSTILQELVDELPSLQSAGGSVSGATAQRMVAAVEPHARGCFVTPMAAVAGAVADEVLAAMRAVPLSRAYVNNGGDIALHLAEGSSFEVLIAGLAGESLGRVRLGEPDGVCGIATSGRGGRSLTMGIADSVTVLAHSAAVADAAATLIANAVDLPGHSAIIRMAAEELRPGSDLGRRLVVTHCGALEPGEVAEALDRGLAVARGMFAEGLILGAAIFLRQEARALLPELALA